MKVLCRKLFEKEVVQFLQYAAPCWQNGWLNFPNQTGTKRRLEVTNVDDLKSILFAAQGVHLRAVTNALRSYMRIQGV